MSTTVKYKGETLTTVSNTTKTLETKGTWLEDDIELTDVSGGGSTLITKTITNNGTYNASSDNADGYSQVTVTVPASAVDTGTKNITQNGNNQDVVGYAAVDVAVPNTYSVGDEGKVVSSGALVAQTAHADVTPTTSDQTIDTTTNNSIKVKGDANLVAGNIKKGVVIFNTTGTYEGGGGGLDLAAILARTATSINLPDITTLGKDVFYNYTGLQSASLPGVTSAGTEMFRGCTGLTSVSMDNLEVIPGTSFYGCTALTSASFPKLYKVGSQAFYNCNHLTSFVIPVSSSSSDMESSAFNGCSLLESVDYAGGKIQANAFSGCAALDVLVLRRSSGPVSLYNVNAFNNTPFKNGGTGGTIYIPESLYNALGTGTNDYRAASNWSTVYGYGTITFAKIEGSYYETHYADGTVMS